MGLVCGALGWAASPALALNVEVVNESGQPPQNVYLTLHGGSSSDGQLEEEKPKPLSEVHDSTFSLERFSGRLYVSFGGSYTERADGLEAPTRYDKIELTTPGVADVTAVDFFAIPFDLQALDSQGAQVGDALTYRCYTSTILSKLRELAPSAEVTSGGQFLRFRAPKNAWSSYPSMAPYVHSMAGQRIEVDDEYANSEYPPKLEIKYSGTFEADGSITLTGTLINEETHKAEPNPEPVRIEGSTLPEAAYTGNGPFTVGGQPKQVGDNRWYSVIYRDIVAGFELGYWGGRYGNNTRAWKFQPDFAAARASAAPYATYNEYAAIINAYSNTYGAAFNELGPTSLTVPLEAQTATLRVTIDPDQGPSTPGCAGESTPQATPVSPPPNTGKKRRTSPGRVHVRIDSGAARLDKRGRVLLALTCSGDPCRGELTLSGQSRVIHNRHRRHGRRKARRAVSRKRRHATRALPAPLGHVEFAIGEGKTQLVWVAISRSGRASIVRAHGHGLSVVAKALVGPRSAPTVAGQRRVTLTSYRAPRRRR